MTFRNILSIDETNCNNVSDTETFCSHGHAVGLSLKALSLGVIFIVSMAMNVTICLVFYKKSQLLTVSNTFVLNLICCQLVLCIAVLPFTLVSVFSSEWIFHDVWCHIQGFIFTVCIVLTQVSLTVVAVDRNYAIICSLRYPYVFTQKRSHIGIVVLWAVSVAVCIPPLAGFGRYKYSAYQNTCMLDWNCSKIYSTIFLSVGFLIPLLIQSWCYMTIFRAAINHTKRNNRVFPSVPSGVSTTRETEISVSDDGDQQYVIVTRYKSMECKAIRTILLIACSYGICWVPYLVCAVSEILEKTVSYEIYSFSIIMVFLNTSFDALVYVFMNRTMRYEIYKFYCDSMQKFSGHTSTVNDSDDYISSTNISTSQSTSRGRNPFSKARYPKPGISCKVMEMKTIQEETESVHVRHDKSSKSGASSEILLCPLDLNEVDENSIECSSVDKITVSAKVHGQRETTSKQSDIKQKRSRSEIWSAKEQESFLFFDLGETTKKLKPEKKTKRSRSELWSTREEESFLFFDLGINKKTTKSKGPQNAKETLKGGGEKTKSVTSTFIQNTSRISLHDLDIVTELSVDIRRKRGKSERKDRSAGQARKCLSA